MHDISGTPGSERAATSTFTGVFGGGGSISTLNTEGPKCSRQIAVRSFFGRSSVEKRTIEKSFRSVVMRIDVSSLICLGLSRLETAHEGVATVSAPRMRA